MGNTLFFLKNGRGNWDHPHLRGEYGTSCWCCDGCLGSPPLTWGIQIFFKNWHGSVRITPTYVGNTTTWRRRLTNDQDHPHLRGEYAINVIALITALGSPPLTWGIRGLIMISAWEGRITPTYVGNTWCWNSKWNSWKDHPHLRGEYLMAQLAANPPVGSPPLTWGIRLIYNEDSAKYRITPTYVGNTQSSHR